MSHPATPMSGIFALLGRSCMRSLMRCDKPVLGFKENSTLSSALGGLRPVKM